MLYLFFILLLMAVVFAVVWLVTRSKEAAEKTAREPDEPAPNEPPEVL